LYEWSRYGVTIEIRPRQSIGSSDCAFVAAEYFSFAAEAIFGAWSAKNCAIACASSRTCAA
jgi:hypothetical protein